MRLATEKMINKLKRITNRAILKGNNEKAMSAISIGCQILYEYNQCYTDDDFENGVISIAKRYQQQYKEKLVVYQHRPDTVLFYDGFGLDTRGVAKMYLNALKKNGYHIVYVTDRNSQGQMPDTDAILEDADAECHYISFGTSYTKWAVSLLEIIFATFPKAMFFYTVPYDSAGAVAFATMDGRADKFLIDLTDHAFWLGTKCNDYFCGSREMSASNQVYERGIDRSKIIKLGVNVMVDADEGDHSGLPFDPEKEKYLFSGGALYKTLGDERRDYYRIVDHVLGGHPDVFFLYAGEGDRSEMDKILRKYPERAFLISERKDFYWLIRHCTLYLNTYPMFGGMMMKYAALAGKIPVTLKHENDADGLLLDQASRRIEYETYEELTSDVDRLLSEPEYLKEREMLLQGSVISEERFVRNVRSTIENHRTDYEHGNEHIDTSRFQKEFYERFNLKAVKKAASKRINLSLAVNFPWIGLNLTEIAIRKIFSNK